jgi:perosamine synthetase
VTSPDHDPKFACFITVRTASSRLPKKALLKLKGKTVLEHLIERVKCVRHPVQIVVCTTTLNEDDVLRDIAANNAVACYRGSSADKLARWLGAAREFGVDYFVTVDGDDLFCDPHLIDLAIRQVRTEPCDFLRAPEGLVCGGFTYCICAAALERVCSRKATDDTEMMWVYFTETDEHSVADLKVDGERYFTPNVRLTLDYAEDFLFFAKVFDELDMAHNSTPLIDILAFLERRPDIPAINWFRQAEFLENQRRRTRLCLKTEAPAAGKGWRFQGNELRYVKEVLDSGFGSSTTGTMNTRFEKAFAGKFGVRYAIASNSGTSTLHQALAAFGVGPGDEVIVPALTVVMCGFAVLHAGATPVFADVDPDTFLMDPEDIRRKLTARTKAIMPVHLYGQVCDMGPIMELAELHGLQVLEDCAQCCLGTDGRGRLAGTIGHAGSFSFENSKHLSTGDGGMLVTDDEALAERMRKFGGLGFKNIQAATGQVRKNKDAFQDPAYLRHDSFGYNYRMPEVAAAVGLGQLENLEPLVARRVAMGEKYRGVLAGCGWLVPQSVPSGFKPSYYTFGARFGGEEKKGVTWREFRRKFIENGGDGIYSAWALVYNEPIFKMIDQTGAYFPGGPGQSRLHKGFLREVNCPHAEALQPRLMQFTTNQASEREMDLQTTALARTIRYYD